MNELGFRRWLRKRNQRGHRSLKEISIETYITDARRVESHYGNFDQLFAEGRLEEALDVEVPDIMDKNRPDYRRAVKYYLQYRTDTS